MSGQLLSGGEYAGRMVLYYWDTGAMDWAIAVVPAGGGGGGAGDASAANQTTEIARLTSILAQLDVALSTRASTAKQDTLLTELQAKADLTETQPVSLASMPSTPVTNANLDAALSTLATQATLAAILAKIIAAPATEAKQDAGNTSLATIAGKDFATQTTLAAVLAKLIAAPSTEAKQDTIISGLASLLLELSAKTEPADSQHVTVDSMPPVSAATSADVALADDDAGYIDGQTGKNLTQTPDGRLRVLAGAVVSDTIDSLLAGMQHSLSLTADGRLRVATAGESNNFAPWGTPESYGTQVSHVVGSHPLAAW